MTMTSAGSTRIVSDDQSDPVVIGELLLLAARDHGAGTGLALAAVRPRPAQRVHEHDQPRPVVHQDRQPDLIDGSRKRRIAAGAGLPIQDVSRLLKQHKQLNKTMKQLSKGGGMQRFLGAMRKGGGQAMFRGRR